MIPPVAGVLIVMGGAVATSSQDAIPVVRARYHRVTFENDDVRVIHIEIPGGADTDYHEHTLDSVAVALTPASVTLQPLGGAAGTAMFTSGDAIFTPAPTPYTHRVGNAGASEVRLATVELKRSASSSSAVPPAGERPAGLLLDNGRVRVRRVSLAPGESTTPLQGPALRVFITAGAILESGRRVEVASGAARWTPSGQHSKIASVSDANLTYVDVLLK